MKDGNRVLFYGGDFGYCFSNFASFGVEWRGRRWMTSEHAYQAAKFDDLRVVNEIHAAMSAHAALKLAKEYADQVRVTWADEKVAVMKDIITRKFEQHPYIQKQLRESGDLEIIENSPKDSFWGRGPDWKGQNMLGKLWMEVRAEKFPPQ